MLCRGKDVASTYRLPSLKNWGVLNFRLELQTMEGDEYAETRR